MLSDEEVKAAQEKALRRLLVRGIYPEDITYEERYDPASMAVIFDVRVRLRFSEHVLRREIPQAPDPLAQGFAAIGLLIHESEKARQRTYDYGRSR